jgi:hypothetical protein
VNLQQYFEIHLEQDWAAAFALLPPNALLPNIEKRVKDCLRSGRLTDYEKGKITNALAKYPAPDNTPPPVAVKEKKQKVKEPTTEGKTNITPNHPLYLHAVRLMKERSATHALMVENALSAEPNQDKLAKYATLIMGISSELDKIYKKNASKD